MEKLKSKLKKSGIHKKFGKYCSILGTLFNICPTNEPQRNIAWCNGGLASGMSREDIVQFFCKFGIIQSVVLIPKKSISFITFKDLSSAILCMDTVNDNKFFHQMNGSMCLLYVDKIPTVPPLSTELPPGSILLNDFISAEKEIALLRCINNTGNDWQLLKQRKVKHYGYEFIYGENCANRIKKIDDIPLLCNYFWERMDCLGYKLDWKPDQLTVNCYEPGQGIPPHIDTHSAFEDPILVVSLGSDIQMEFRSGVLYSSVYIPRRSMFILAGESRYAWQHAILSRTKDLYVDKDLGYIVSQRGTRVSLTFRRLRNEPCYCVYPMFCDSRITPIFNENFAVDLEEKYVNQTYNIIAEHFSQTRHKPWPKALEFLQEFPKGSLVLDVGCGNGKYFGFNKNIFEIGCELCPSLAQICYNRGFETVNSNCLSLPFKTSIFDGILCIAVLHHLSTKQRRQNAMNELIRVLKPNGKALVYVWSEQQTLEEPPISTTELENNDLQVGSNVVLNSDVTLPIVANDGQNFKRKDILVPWKTSEEKNIKTYLRYYHIFEEDELNNICATAGGKIIKIYHDTGNWCVQFTKQ